MTEIDALIEVSKRVSGYADAREHITRLRAHLDSLAASSGERSEYDLGLRNGLAMAEHIIGGNKGLPGLVSK